MKGNKRKIAFFIAHVMVICYFLNVGWFEYHLGQRLGQEGDAFQIFLHEGIFFVVGNFLGSWYIWRQRDRSIQRSIRLCIQSSVALIVLFALYASGFLFGEFWILLLTRLGMGCCLVLVYYAIDVLFRCRLPRGEHNERKRRVWLTEKAWVVMGASTLANFIGSKVGIAAHLWVLLAGLCFGVILLSSVALFRLQKSSSMDGDCEENQAGESQYETLSKSRKRLLLVLLIVVEGTSSFVFTEMVPDYLPLSLGKQASEIAVLLGIFLFGGLIGPAIATRFRSQANVPVIIGCMITMALTLLILGSTQDPWLLRIAFALAGVAKGIVGVVVDEAIFERYGPVYNAVKQTARAFGMCVFATGFGWVPIFFGSSGMWLALGGFTLLILLALIIPQGKTKPSILHQFFSLGGDLTWGMLCDKCSRLYLQAKKLSRRRKELATIQHAGL